MTTQKWTRKASAKSDPASQVGQSRFKQVEPWIAQLISDNNLMVLRNKKSGKALGVSYTEDGLKQCFNKFGKSLYYKHAFIREGRVQGDTRKSPWIVVEKFEPRNHKTKNNQVAEYLWISKALKMLYTPNATKKQYFARNSGSLAKQPNGIPSSASPQK